VQSSSTVNGHISNRRCQFFYEKREERKGKGKERALVYWLTLLYLCVSRLYVDTATLSGKLVKVVIIVMRRSLVGLLIEAICALLFAARRRL
jgi:hypothetical protein